jgi:hypothetical protein
MAYTGGSVDQLNGKMRQSQVRCVCSDSEEFKYDGEANLIYVINFYLS